MIIFCYCISVNAYTQFGALLYMSETSCKVYLIKISQAVKKGAAPKKAMVKKRCEIQGGGQEMAVMVG